jgi:hypothetical protein
MSVHSLFKYFQLVSAHALSSTVHDSPRRFREKTLKRALQFLPKEGEKEPRDLINHLEWGLRGAKHKQISPHSLKLPSPRPRPMLPVPRIAMVKEV